MIRFHTPYMEINHVYIFRFTWTNAWWKRDVRHVKTDPTMLSFPTLRSKYKIHRCIFRCSKTTWAKFISSYDLSTLHVSFQDSCYPSKKDDALLPKWLVNTERRRVFRCLFRCLKSRYNSPSFCLWRCCSSSGTLLESSSQFMCF